MPTEMLFRDESYLTAAEATVTARTERGIILDRSIFYPTGGGQPGDSGEIELPDGSRIAVTEAVYAGDKWTVELLLAEGAGAPPAGTKIVQHIDWPRRYRFMRMHTAMHLLSKVLPYAVTGGQIGADEGRLDFDIPDAGLEKDEITRQLNDLIAGNHDVTAGQMTDAELLANPGIVKTMSVKPPTGSGTVRLINIGNGLDLQPCGGTHVANTSEIGEMIVTRIEKKGKINRRVRIRFADEVSPGN